MQGVFGRYFAYEYRAFCISVCISGRRCRLFPVFFSGDSFESNCVRHHALSGIVQYRDRAQKSRKRRLFERSYFGKPSPRGPGAYSGRLSPARKFLFLARPRGSRETPEKCQIVVRKPGPASRVAATTRGAHRADWPRRCRVAGDPRSRHSPERVPETPARSSCSPAGSSSPPSPRVDRYWLQYHRRVHRASAAPWQLPTRVWRVSPRGSEAGPLQPLSMRVGKVLVTVSTALLSTG